MALFSRRMGQFIAHILILLLFNVQFSEENSDSDLYDSRDDNVDLILLSPFRVRRELPSVNNTVQPPRSPNLTSVTVVSTNEVTTPPVATTQKVVSSPSAVKATSNITQRIPNLGVNGSGILRDNNVPKVSDPIVSDSSYNNTNSASTGLTTTVTETNPIIKPDESLDNLTKTDYEYYHSTFIGEPEFFKDHWANINKMEFEIHPILSASHRRATMVTPSFPFKFYGQVIKNITIATGGFIYTGDHVHSWLAATQYIAPLMANFDTRATNNSVVKIADDGTNFTVVWENVTLQHYDNASFTFAVTLRKDADIIFAYKDIPIPVQFIEDKDHPVKVGISDAYMNDRLVFYKRRKTIYEYHRINFLDHNITSGTILRLHPNPTCLLFESCTACMNHNTTFNCTWCPATERCSSGIDRKKQDWLLRNCDKMQVSIEEECPKIEGNKTSTKTDYDTLQPKNVSGTNDALVAVQYDHSGENTTHSSMGGVVILFMVIILLGFGSAWVFYAYKNPHTRSGQILIKYRPSTWSWKRGEARYTAATIHM